MIVELQSFVKKYVDENFQVSDYIQEKDENRVLTMGMNINGRS
jgi:hypothetical protein